MKLGKAEIMQLYKKWLDREQGFSRQTMTRKEYAKMMKVFSEAGLKRTNFAVSVKKCGSEKAYRAAKAARMRAWRARAFAPQTSPGDQKDESSRRD